VAAFESCEKAIRGLVEPGGLIELFVDVAVKGFAGGAVELFKVFFDALLGLLVAVARPYSPPCWRKSAGGGP